MNVVKVPAYQTSDDQIFTIESEANFHAFELAKKEEINRFLSTEKGLEYTDRGKVSAARIIGDYIDSLSECGLGMPWVDQCEESKGEQA